MEPERIPNIAGHSIFDEHSIIEEHPVIGKILTTFGLTLVDWWVNLYRNGMDGKSWHQDQYHYRTTTSKINCSFKNEITIKMKLTQMQLLLLLLLLLLHLVKLP